MSALDIPADDYHADKVADVPTLSASIARILCAKTPAHAKAAHPKLNPNYERKSEDKFELGTAVHSFLLQGVDLCYVVHENDWRKKVAQEARDDARAQGKIPMLAKNWHEAQAMLEAVRAQIDQLPITPRPFTNGEAEKTIVWTEDGVACRARLDWIHDGALVIDDLKSTSASADPAAWTKTLYGMGGDLQAAFYIRGVQAVYGVSMVQWRWVVCETYAPYAISVVDLSPSALALANDKLDWAIGKWRDCLAADRWPGYADRVASIDAPAWHESSWYERRSIAAMAA